MRSEYPSELVLRPGIWRSPVQLLAPPKSLFWSGLGHSFINFGMSCLGCVWQWFEDISDGVGMVWENYRRGRTTKHITKSKIDGSTVTPAGVDRSEGSRYIIQVGYSPVHRARGIREERVARKVCARALE